jgi:hypothetical protein
MPRVGFSYSPLSKRSDADTAFQKQGPDLAMCIPSRASSISVQIAYQFYDRLSARPVLGEEVIHQLGFGGQPMLGCGPEARCASTNPRRAVATRPFAPQGMDSLRDGLIFPLAVSHSIHMF